MKKLLIYLINIETEIEFNFQECFMKNIRIVLILTFSLLLNGCVDKETMNFFTNNWFIAFYFTGFIGSSGVYFCYRRGESFFVCMVTLGCIILSISNRCGLWK